jgi:murein DD-endopeptidase MepM/ murein hydrolase activator NlpD
MRAVVLFVVGLSALPGALAAQDVDVEWYGPAPKQGTLTYIVLQASLPVVSVRGTLGDLPLAFTRVDAARFAALAGVPVGAPDSLVARLQLEFAKGRVAPVERALPVMRTRFPSERLSVDPRFTARPDSALAARIAREAARSRRVTAEALATPRLWHERFMAPRQARLTSTFGIGRVFNGQLRSRHLGIDYDGEVGDPVRAANRGVVALVGDLYYSGGTVFVNHGGGLITGYFHLSRTLVNLGDTVERGQLIGRVGQSGRVTGPHLHFSVRVGATAVDGRSLLTLPPLERLFEKQ